LICRFWAHITCKRYMEEKAISTAEYLPQLPG